MPTTVARAKRSRIGGIAALLGPAADRRHRRCERAAVRPTLETSDREESKMTEIEDRPRRTRRRRGLAGTVSLAAVGLVLLVLGGIAATDAAADDGYVNLGAGGTYGTAGYAMATDRTNWDRLAGLTGTVRIRVAAEDGGSLFAAVADPATAGRYLTGTRYTTVHKRDGSTDHDGAAPGSPSTVDWTVSSTGPGTRTLQWPARDGEQVLVVMNADGSPAVRGRVESVAVTIPGLGWIGAGLLVAGAGLSVAAIARIRRSRA
jgi:hypothetical protein